MQAGQYQEIQPPPLSCGSVNTEERVLLILSSCSPFKCFKDIDQLRSFLSLYVLFHLTFCYFHILLETRPLIFCITTSLYYINELFIINAHTDRVTDKDRVFAVSVSL
ncbi:hypothetical protein Q8A73_013249 [Channa argus]|nr:hypothetical protein Q8A73_013249 [Channa argus]